MFNRCSTSSLQKPTHTPYLQQWRSEPEILENFSTQDLYRRNDYQQFVGPQFRETIPMSIGTNIIGRKHNGLLDGMPILTRCSGTLRNISLYYCYLLTKGYTWEPQVVLLPMRICWMFLKVPRLVPVPYTPSIFRSKLRTLEFSTNMWILYEKFYNGWEKDGPSIGRSNGREIGGTQIKVPRGTNRWE
jgi:hypothetical protein